MKFRKKPVIIQAFQFGGSGTQFPDWVGDVHNENVEGVFLMPDGEALLIPTPEGIMHAGLSDWVIRGVKGEIYPCKPDIFEMTYEPAEGERGMTLLRAIQVLSMMMAAAARGC